MGSSSRTENLGLNRWIKSDRPVMEDFNADNEIVDSILGGHISNDEIHLNETQRQALALPYDMYIYHGTGVQNRTIELGFDFEPRLCILLAVSAPIGVIDIPNDTHYNYFGVATKSGSTDGLTLSGKTLSVIQGGVMVARYEMRSFNEIGRSYLVIGFR